MGAPVSLALEGEKIMKKRNLVVLIFLLGLFLGYGGNEFFRSINLSKWQVGENYRIYYEFEAINTEIPLPEIKKFRAKVKFIQPTNNSHSMRSLGYVAEVLVDNLKKRDIPEKYKQERKENEYSTIIPLKEVTYVIQFDFALKDKDGFEIAKVSSKRLFISSGQLNRLQGIGKPDIPISIIRRVEKVEPQLIVVKCETCESNNSFNE